MDTTDTALAPPLHLGPVEVWPPVVLAPMAGVTDAPFRTLCRRHGGGLYVSEMVGARGLVEGNHTSQMKAAFAPDESPRSIQLYATAADEVGRAVELLVASGAGPVGSDAGPVGSDAGPVGSGAGPVGSGAGPVGSGAAGHGARIDHVDHIDLNFGCPAPKVTRHGGGAALPWRTGLYADIVGAAVRAAGDVPVTVKLRLGIDADHLTYLDAGRIAADLGVAAVALHARTAEDRYGPPAQWRHVAALVEAVDVPVLGNGDVWEAEDARRMLAQTGCAGVVVGRGCLGRPWLFRDLQAMFEGREVPPGPRLGEVADLLIEHAQLLVDWHGPDKGLRELRKHTGWYLQGYPVGGQLRRRLNQVGSLDEVHELLAGVDRTLPFDESVRRNARGHTTPPKRPVLPHGWLDSRETPTELPTLAGSVVSGG